MKKFLIALIVLSACDEADLKEGEGTTDYIVFGHFYGECVGEQCVEIFKLTKDQLSEDSNDTYPGSDHGYSGNFRMSTSRFGVLNNSC